jgi:nucleotide-binding universal stress UspA family protein
MTVAVAHNESPEGQAALLQGAREARLQQSSLAVLHILEHDRSDSQEHRAGLSGQVQHALQAAGLAEVPWTLHTASEAEGRAEALVRLTEEVSADLLVIGSRRRTPIGKFLLGSTVQRVVLDSPVPVLVVKAPKPRPLLP